MILEIVEQQFSQMKISDDEKRKIISFVLDDNAFFLVCPGMIITGRNLISIRQNLFKTITEIENGFYIGTTLTNSPLSILQINQSEYIWFESFLEADLEKMNGLASPDFQMLLFEAGKINTNLNFLKNL